MPGAVICKDIDGNEHSVDIARLRWRPSAYAVIIKDECVLAIPAFGGYSLPGGALELGETIQQALEREVNEETGLTVTVAESLGVDSNFFVLPGVSHKGNNVQSILLFFRAEYVSGELRGEDFSEAEKEFGGFPEWIPLAKLPDITVAGTDWRKFAKKP